LVAMATLGEDGGGGVLKHPKHPWCAALAQVSYT